MSSDRAVLVDAAAVTLVGTAICVGLRETGPMTAVVAGAWVLRLGLWSRLSPEERPLRWPGELVFLGLCALLGGFNDWNTVVRHQVYSYGVPSDIEPFSSIPAWMFAYWGLILRLVATLGLWPRLGEPGPSGALRGAGYHPRWRVALLLALTLGTRQTVYRFWSDPWLSWIPFALALVLHRGLFPWGRRERNLALLAITLGPLAEAALIQIGGLHRYALGWFFGVPLWIVLWWVLAVLLWSELVREALARGAPAGLISRAHGGERSATPFPPCLAPVVTTCSPRFARFRGPSPRSIRACASADFSCGGPTSIISEALTSEMISDMACEPRLAEQ